MGRGRGGGGKGNVSSVGGRGRGGVTWEVGNVDGVGEGREREI